MDKSKIAARIRALLEKTTDNGCTEDEALAAAQKAAEMLEKYNLTVDEVKLREEAIRRSDNPQSRCGHPADERLWKVAAAIAHMLDCRYWTNQGGRLGPCITFFGFAHEVEIGDYLLLICRRAIYDQSAQYQRDELFLLRASVQRARSKSFVDGMVDRLAERIRAMKPKQPPGKGLVVLRGSLIDAEMKAQGIVLKDGRGRGSRDFDSGYGDGQIAADQVSLNAGIKEKAPAALIGGSR